MKTNILVVDDTPDNLHLLMGVLREEGYKVRPAPNGSHALATAQANPPDLILLDILMPEMDGYQVCEQLKADARTWDIPVIFISGRGEVFDKVKAFSLGGVDYITRPFQPEEVLARVKTHLTLRNLQKHLEEVVAERTADLQQEIVEHKRTREVLRDSEQQYRLLVEHVADGIGIIQEGKLVFVNEALLSMLGFTPGQLVGKPVVDLFQKNYRAQFRAIYEQLQQGDVDPQSWPVLQYVVNRDDREIWLEGRQSVITWEGKPAILISMRDITKRKLREIEIEQEREHLQKENVKLRATMKDRYRFGDIIGKSQVIQEVYELILKASASEKDVLICGESGTGKELIAWTIHHLSKRKGKAFVPVNCGAIQETLFEREFFGHRKGAFTGADRDQRGFFGAAHRGTLFLDEVGELTPAMQVKLLRAVESGEYTPIGDSTPKTADVRIVAATRRNLADQVEKGMMREDFFYRIHVIVIAVPPLRDRQEDIPLLVEHFLKRHFKSQTPPPLPGSVLDALYNHDWPGNIRQLQNALYRYLTVGHLDFTAPRSTESIDNAGASDINPIQQGTTLHEAVEQFEKRLILRTLEQHHWHRSNTAATLGIPRSTLRRKMKSFGLR